MLGDVGDPELVRRVSGELTRHQVIEDGIQHPGPARALRAAPVHALKSQAVHEALDALPGAPDTVREAQLGVDAGAAVGAAAALVRLLDQLAQPLVLHRPAGWFPVAPRVVATPLRPAGRGT